MIGSDGATDHAPPWRGQFADGQSAALHEVLLSLQDGALVGVRVDDGVELFRWPTASIAADRSGSDRATLTSSAAAPEAALTIGSALLATGLVTAQRPSPRMTKRTILLCAAATVLAAGAIYLSLDPVARAVARRIPPSYEADLGRGLEALIARHYCETPAERAILARLAVRLEGTPRELHIMDSDMVNAFTFPGGVVIVTKGLLSEAKSADEVAGVLAHELEHVHQRHVMIHFVRGSMLTALWQATVGDYAGLFVIDPKTAFDIASLRFSRADEGEADRGAVARLSRAGISPAGLRDFFQRLRGKTDAIPTWLSNHPATTERIEAIAPGAPASSKTPALAPADWEALRRACGGGADPDTKDAGAADGGR
ncbi:MAG: M48 family metallopeptidase [Bacteroidota bacterium]